MLAQALSDSDLDTFPQPENKLIRMQLAFRKVDIDILSLNFVIYAVKMFWARRSPLGKLKYAKQKF